MTETDADRGSRKVLRHGATMVLIGFAWLLVQVFPFGDPLMNDLPWVAGYTFGTPAGVDVPEEATNDFTGWTSCTITYSKTRGDGDRVHCTGASWTVAGDSTVGDLVGQARHLLSDGDLVPVVDARVFGDTAYTKPNGTHLAMAAGATGLVLSGLVGVAVGGVGSLRARRRAAQPVPLAELSSRHDLGVVVATHRTQQNAAKAFVTQVAAAIAVGATVGVLAEDDTDGIIVFAVIAGIAWLVIARVTWSALARRARRGAVAAVCEHGLVLWSPKRTVVAPWRNAEFTGATPGLFSGGSTGSFTIRSNGSAAEFDEGEWERFDELRETVHRNVIAVAYAQTEAALNSGATVTLGKFTLRRGDLTYGDTTLPYDGIRTVTVESTNLVILPKQATISPVREPLSDIPNADVLVGIVNSRRQQAPIE